MVELRAKPYNLTDANTAWAESTIAGMTGFHTNRQTGKVHIGDLRFCA